MSEAPRELSADPARRPDYFAGGDLLRVVAALGVVVIHTCVWTLPFYRDMPAADWWAANVLSSASRWAVPAFVMLSGALLLHPLRQESAGQFYRKRLARIGVPLAFWSAAYLLWWVGVRGEDVSPLNAVGLLVRGKPFNHMYFLFIMAGLYVFFPFLRLVARALDDRQLPGLVALLLVTASLADFAARAEAGTQYSAFSYFVPYIGYFLAGHYLRRRSFSVRQRRLAWAAAVAGISLTAAGAGLVEAHWRDKAQLAGFGSHFAPLAVVTALAVFIALTGVRIAEGGKVQRVLRAVAPCTFGVYLVHPMLMDLVDIHGPTVRWPTALAGLFLWSAVVFLASLVVTWVLRRVPVLRRVVG